MELDSAHNTQMDCGSKRSKSPGEIRSSNDDPTRPRWMNEMARGKSTKTKRGKMKGFGSFYQRTPGHYSEAEQMAKQGHADRIRTVDLLPDHRMERELAEDDSQKLSDWHDRTSIDPVAHKICKEAEEEFARRREANKRLKINTNK